MTSEDRLYAAAVVALDEDDFSAMDDLWLRWRNEYATPEEAEEYDASKRPWSVAIATPQQWITFQCAMLHPETRTFPAPDWPELDRWGRGVEHTRKVVLEAGRRCGSQAWLDHAAAEARELAFVKRTQAHLRVGNLQGVIRNLNEAESIVFQAIARLAWPSWRLFARALQDRS